MRRLFARPALLCLAAAVLLQWTAPLHAQGQRKLGTIGPPPRQDPQRMTAAEGMPPLPLPATPLRRSEPKAEPAPPLFVGKLAYGTTQDYMPNPGDVDNLLRHVRAQLDAWYGWRIVSLDELVAARRQDRSLDIPMLYLTGYESFELTPEQRDALRQYLIDGGALVGDATLGSPSFTQSFIAEMHAMFPQRPMKPLPLDHPVHRGYYPYKDVAYFAVEQGTGVKTSGPPELLGLNIAARTAVILSPFDMTCGWDEFYAPPASARVPDAPRTRAMMPPDAIRTGINIVAYVSAQRRFAKAQAQTLNIVAEQPQQRAALPLALLRHQGDWNPDPSALQQLIRFAAQETSVPMGFDLRPVDAKVEMLADTPIVIVNGLDDPALSDGEVDALRRHVQAGGFVFINNTSGYATFDRAARDLIARIAPDTPLAQLPADHAVFSALHPVSQARDAGSLQPRDIELWGVTIGGRTAIVYSPADTLALLKGVHDPYANAYDAATARALSLNILCHALRGR